MRTQASNKAHAIRGVRLLSQGYSVQSACYSLKTSYTGTGLDTYVICGSQYITLYESA